jgi:hypothetical protein
MCITTIILRKHPVFTGCAREVFRKSKMEIDDHIVDQIFDALRPENSDLVRFGDEKINMKLKMAMKNLMERTWSSNSLSDSEKIQRVVACVDTVEFADSVHLSDVASSILQVIFPCNQHQLAILAKPTQWDWVVRTKRCSWNNFKCAVR